MEVVEVSASAARREGPRLITQEYEGDPLVCPRCGGALRIIACIEPPAVIGKILSHRGLWPPHSHSSPESLAA